MSAPHIRYFFVGTLSEFHRRFRYVQIDRYQQSWITRPDQLQGVVINPWDQVEFGASFSRWDGDQRKSMWDTIIACQIAGRRIPDEKL